MTEIRPRAVRPTEIERLYGYSHSTLWRFMRMPGFPVYRVGRVVRIPMDDFERWLKAQSSEAVNSNG